MCSNNGSNFKGAESELKKTLDDLDQNDIVRSCTSKGTKWHFNPPIAPHMGGC